MGKVDLIRFESPTALAQAAARQWLNTVALSNKHCAAFSGGRIAENFFDAITAEVLQRKLTLAEVHFFWADERCVPADHADSNYRITHSRLLNPLNIPNRQVHRIRGELDPLTAASDASRDIAKLALDFVFLGMGEDGHIASIFPGAKLDESPNEAYCPVFDAPKPPPQRVTLSMKAIVAAANVWVLVSGAGKKDALGKSLNTVETPLGHLLEKRAFTRIFTDI